MNLALADLNEAVRLEPVAQYHLWRGAVHLHKRQFDQAGRDFNEAIRQEPGKADGYYLRALTFEQMGEDAKARKDFAEAFRLNPEVANRFR